MLFAASYLSIEIVLQIPIQEDLYYACNINQYDIPTYKERKKSYFTRKYCEK